MSFDAAKVQRILNKIPSRYRGPGGAIAVLKDGQLVGQKVWGYADMERRIHMTPQTVMPICSITKQFVSALLFDLSQNPPASMDKSLGTFDEQMLARLREILPSQFVEKSGMTVDNLVDMASGLRDYWALCTVEGSRPETIYSLHEHNADMLKRIKSLHFEPGTEYSYSNTNFNIVERLIEHVTKDSLDNLLNERILRPAKMTTARLNPRTDRLPPPVIGYEGSEKAGFFPAPNFIEWSADAGMVASLNDMIAYEKYFDSKYGDKESGYRKRVTTQKYHDGAHAPYRYGLANSKIGEYDAVGHGGALRGFHLMRLYVASERLSVMVMFNSHLDPGEAANNILKHILNVPEEPTLKIDPSENWFGSFLDEETQLAVRVTPNGQGKISLLYSRTTENLKLTDTTHAKTNTVEASIDGDVLHVKRIYENRVLKAKRLAKKTDSSTKPPVQGTYRCEETESTFICEGEDDMLYACFDGYFGRGPPHLMTYLGDDVWVFADPRAMDDTPPGDWTVNFIRDAQGAVVKANIGCWLARKLEFVRR